MGTLTRQKKIIKRVRNYVMITVAAFIYAISISLFLDPNNIAPGRNHRRCYFNKQIYQYSYRYIESDSECSYCIIGIIEV